MCRPFGKTLATINTLSGEIEVVAVAKELERGMGIHCGYLSLSTPEGDFTPGEDIRSEFCDFLSPLTWERAWRRLWWQLQVSPRYQHHRVLGKPEIPALLNAAREKLATLPIQ
jgi:hypothetical protein